MFKFIRLAISKAGNFLKPIIKEIAVYAVEHVLSAVADKLIEKFRSYINPSEDDFGDNCVVLAAA